MTRKQLSELAHKFGVTPRTIYRWAKTMPKIFDTDFDRSQFARPREVAAELGVTRAVINGLWDRGEIRGFKLTDKILFIEIASVREWFADKIKTL